MGWVILWFLYAPLSPPTVSGQPAGPNAEQGKPDPLSVEQEALLLRYRKFGQVLQEMTEYLRQTEPDRAALLSQVSRKSNELQIVEKMNRLLESIEKGRLGEAVEQEAELVVAMQTILDMMNSEDREKELAEEKARVEAELKELNRLIGGQRDVRAATERNVEKENLAPRQEKLEQDARRLQERRQQSKKSQSGEPNDKQGNPDSGKEGENSPEKEEEKEDQNSDSANKSEPQGGAKELENARKAMRAAIEKLKQGKGRDASEQQDQALLELEKAKKKLEEILRQMREEERDRMLVGLEERLQRLLAGEQVIYTETVQVAEIPLKERTSRHRNKGIQLSRQQGELKIESESLLRLLREEGSAIAFPEVVSQVRDDMESVALRLGKGDFGELTVAIENDVISSLKEMILALQKEMEENRQQKMKEGPESGGSPQDPNLVEQLAELKILRSLQVRINNRTRELGKLVTGEQADDSDLIRQLEKLAEAQRRIQRATYDLATGKNE